MRAASSPSISKRSSSGDVVVLALTRDTKADGVAVMVGVLGEVRRARAPRSALRPRREAARVMLWCKSVSGAEQICTTKSDARPDPRREAVRDEHGRHTHRHGSPFRLLHTRRRRHRAGTLPTGAGAATPRSTSASASRTSQAAAHTTTRAPTGVAPHRRHHHHTRSARVRVAPRGCPRRARPTHASPRLTLQAAAHTTAPAPSGDSPHRRRRRHTTVTSRPRHDPRRCAAAAPA